MSVKFYQPLSKTLSLTCDYLSQLLKSYKSDVIIINLCNI